MTAARSAPGCEGRALAVPDALAPARPASTPRTALVGELALHARAAAILRAAAAETEARAERRQAPAA